MMQQHAYRFILGFFLLGIWGAGTAAALTAAEALEILGREVLQPSASDAEVTAYLSPAPLVGGVVEPRLGEAPMVDVAGITGNAQWFALVDLDPCALWEHDALYVFIDDVTGVVETFPATDWPLIDGVAFGQDETPGARVLGIFTIIPRPEPAESAAADAPAADYGDAPDDLPAYAVGVTGRFPTRFATTNAVGGRPGGHVLNVTADRLGVLNSAEIDVLDPNDPDGATNLKDADRDERMFVALDQNTTPPRARLIFDVTLGADGFDGTRYLNVLIDFDRDGRWRGNAAGAEWAVVNAAVTGPVNTTVTRVSPAFDWSKPGQLPTLVWSRVALTRTAVDPGAFGADGWDGSGAFDYGEIEDAKIYLRSCPGLGCPPAPPPPGDPGDDDEGDGDDETPPPGPEVLWNDVPIKYKALVIQGIDNPEEANAAQAAATMTTILGDQGYSVSKVKPADASFDNLRQKILDLVAGVTCQDRILIYFVAHGEKLKPGKEEMDNGRMQLQAGKGDDSVLTGNELKLLLDLIPSCATEDCDFPNASCGVTVIIESCYSGRFQGALGGEGQTIVTTSSASEPSYFGADGSGGEFSDRFSECARDASVDQGANGGNEDGGVDPKEASNWAAGRLELPKGKTQTPMVSGGSCECRCPTPIEDCVLAPLPLFFFEPADYGFFGQPLGNTFPEGIEPLPEIETYDSGDLVGEPNEWLWAVQFDWFGEPRGFVGQVLLFEHGPAIRVPIVTTTAPPDVVPPPLTLTVFVLEDFYELRDGQGAMLAFGQWSQYPQDLPPSQFQNTGAVRQMRPLGRCAEVPQDRDFDFDVDLSDFQRLQACASSGPFDLASCTCLDSTADESVTDELDPFEGCMAGPGAAPACGGVFSALGVTGF